MKLNKGVLGFFIAVAILMAVGTVNSKMALPPAGNDGDPTTFPLAGQTCGQCHSGTTPKSAAGKVQISFTDAQGLVTPIDNFLYVPGQVYKVTFHPTVTAARYGFQLSALLTANNTNAGLLVDTSAKTSLTQGPSTKYIGHADADLTNTWEFKWNAPASNEGDVKFYYAFVAANASTTEFGDTVFFGNTTFSADTTVSGVVNMPLSNLLVYPNPATDVVNCSYLNEGKGNTNYELFNSTGERVYERSVACNAGEVNYPISVSGLPTGIYYLQIRSNNRKSVSRVIIE